MVKHTFFILLEVAQCPRPQIVKRDNTALIMHIILNNGAPEYHNQAIIAKGRLITEFASYLIVICFCYLILLLIDLGCAQVTKGNVIHMNN